MLRDRLVCGVNNPSIQRKLLSESSTLTFDGALKIAVAMESATNNLDDIRREVSGALTSSNEGGTFYVKHRQVHTHVRTSIPRNEYHLCPGIPHQPLRFSRISCVISDEYVSTCILDKIAGPKYYKYYIVTVITETNTSFALGSRNRSAVYWVRHT